MEARVCVCGGGKGHGGSGSTDLFTRALLCLVVSCVSAMLCDTLLVAGLI